MRLLVCGGRGYSDKDNVFKVLDGLKYANNGYGDILLIHGAATGADTLADKWAIERGVDRVTFPANWSGRGKAAGPFRNRLMAQLLRPTHYVAFKGGSGTHNMIGRLEAINAVCLYDENFIDQEASEPYAPQTC